MIGVSGFLVRKLDINLVGVGLSPARSRFLVRKHTIWGRPKEYRIAKHICKRCNYCYFCQSSYILFPAAVSSPGIVQQAKEKFGVARPTLKQLGQVSSSEMTEDSRRRGSSEKKTKNMIIFCCI